VTGTREITISNRGDATFEPAEILNDIYVSAANDFDRATVEADVGTWKAENM